MQTEGVIVEKKKQGHSDYQASALCDETQMLITHGGKSHFDVLTRQACC